MYGFNLQTIYQEGKTPADSLERLRYEKSAYEHTKKCAKLLAANYPSLSQAIVQRAEEAYEGYYLLSGSATKTFIGKPASWRENPNHNKEYEYELNRMNQWLDMTYAYFLTGDEKYVQRIILEMEMWIRDCPPPLKLDEEGALDFYGGPKGRWWRILECGIRLYKTWGPIIEIFAPMDVFPEDLFSKIVEILYFQAEMISRFSPVLWPKSDHNHFVMENMGLFKAGGLFPEWKKAELWKKQAVDSLCRALDVQVLDYGAQIEGCPSYHNNCVFWFALALQFGRRYGVTFPAWYETKLDSMGEWALYMTRPNGTNVAWGDTSVLTVTMAQAAVCLYIGNQDSKWLFYSAYLGQREGLLGAFSTYVWYMENPEVFLQDFEEALAHPKEPALPPTVWNKSMKQMSYRSSWSDKDLSFFYSCRSPVQNLHAHIDPCGFDLSALGQAIFVDPGKYTYQEGEDRKHFKQMFWHNTLMINDRDAWEYLASWAYGPMRQGDILHMGQGPRLTWAVGYHNNYAPKVHQRVLCALNSKYVLVLDRITGLKKADKLSMQYHFDGTNVQEEANQFVCRKEDVITTLASTMPQRTIEQAYVSDEVDQKRESSLLVFRDRAEANDSEKIYATFICPDKYRKISITKLKHTREGDMVLISAQIDQEAYQLQYNIKTFDMQILDA